eukprot:3683791-Pyramimonas_sp.AAC.1
MDVLRNPMDILKESCEFPLGFFGLPKGSDGCPNDSIEYPNGPSECPRGSDGFRKEIHWRP